MGLMLEEEEEGVRCDEAEEVGACIIPNDEVSMGAVEMEVLGDGEEVAFAAAEPEC